jgi:hypothetical protein
MITKKYKHGFRCDHTDKNGRVYPTCVAPTRTGARQMMDAIVFSDDYVRNQLEIIAISHQLYDRLDELVKKWQAKNEQI